MNSEILKSPIVLLTDFGTNDPYVGVMKGVITGRAPRATLIDLSHGIPPQNIRAAAFCLKSSVSFFPKNSIFVSIVDPGVGSQRKILWARSQNHQFLAPDNGILSWIPDPLIEIRAVSNQDVMLSTISSTFHGRDIFAPVSAALRMGFSPSRLGPKVKPSVHIPFPEPVLRKNTLIGEILYVDRFGNAVTNLKQTNVFRANKIFFRKKDLGFPRDHYTQAPQGKPLALIGSFGFLELSVNGGNFADRFSVRIGEKIKCPLNQAAKKN